MSGAGLAQLYRLLSVSETSPLTAHDVFERAAQNDKIALETIDRFWTFLADTVSDLISLLAPVTAVTFTGGVILKNGDNWRKSGFQQRFDQMQSQRNNLKPVAFKLLDIDYPDLRGLYQFATSGHDALTAPEMSAEQKPDTRYQQA